MKTLIYSNEWFSGQHYVKKEGHFPFLVHGILQSLSNENRDIFMNLECLFSCIGLKETRENTIKIKKAIRFLHEMEMIEFHKSALFNENINYNITKNRITTPMYIKIINIPKNNFTLIKSKELSTIMMLDIKPNIKAEIYCYFCAIMSHINSESKVAYPRLGTLNFMACVGKDSTCTTYNKRLKELGLLIYDNAGYKNVRDGTYTSNDYARPEHHKELENKIESKRKNHRRTVHSERLNEIKILKNRLGNRIAYRQKSIDESVLNGEEPNEEYIKDLEEMLPVYSELEEERRSLLVRIYGE